MNLPERHPYVAARETLVSFDIDCGELVPSHHFVARGLAPSAIANLKDDPDGRLLVVDLLWEFVPGVTEDEEQEGFFPYLIRFDYSADQPLPWEEDGGGAMGPSEGGALTPGFDGPWPVPDGARLLMFDLFGTDSATRMENDEPYGTLTVNLATKTAAWSART